ncbi:hypothetical protein APS_1600 [Acetobacter pasteurianus subsp. pasteurianus LMG 1262 = NBRC 106471]|nr:hypothetical protein APS_1600 [Acetobacter pasteurianus subsp. pasteurianus LMG 1262 = NBRC 106471]
MKSKAKFDFLEKYGNILKYFVKLFASVFIAPEYPCRTAISANLIMTKG